MSGTDAAIEVLGEALAAYKRRAAELEAIVAQQQAQIAELKAAQQAPKADEEPSG